MTPDFIENKNSPLSRSDLELIEATLLSSQERHFLRVLAHCLACFKSMGSNTSLGPLPKENIRLQWCLNQPKLANEKSFIPILLDQFNSAGRQLEKLASVLGITPLELTTQDLINSSITVTKLDPDPISNQK